MTRVYTFTCLSILSLLFGACASNQDAVSPSGKTRSEGIVKDFKSPSWTALPDGNAPVAHVNGVPISQSSLKRQMASYPSTAPRTLLKRLIRMEVLAQKAASTAITAEPDVQRARRKALVRSYLEDVFQKEYTPDKYPMANVRKDYESNKAMFWFETDAWQAAHLHETCCVPAQEDCDTDEARDCFLKSPGRLWKVYHALTKRAAELKERTPDNVAVLMAKYRTEIGDRNPNLRYEKFSFFYNPNRSHDWHFGRHTVYDQTVAKVVMKAPIGVVQEPIRSKFGWHVMVKTGHQPPQKKTADDPEVIRAIRKRAFPRYQKAAFQHTLRGLAKQYQAHMNKPGLDALDQLQTQ
jgi:hypothetical protein